jgi:hypothetical protein
MENIVLETGLNPIVEISQVGGDLRLTGWDQPQFVAEADDDHSLHLDRDGDRLVLRAADDCTVRLPRGAQVSVRSVGGDAHAKSLEQKLALGNVGGDLRLRQIGSADVGTVGGDLIVKHVAGDLQVGHLGGDLEARGVAGAFKCGNAGGDLYLLEIGGDIQATAGGDVTLSINFAPGHEYSVSAGGDLICRLGPDASARLALVAGGDIDIEVSGAQVEGGSNRKTVSVGGGAAAASLRAGGDLNLTGLSFDPDAMGDFGVMAEEFTAHIESQMADFERQMADLRAGLNYAPSPADAEKIAASARRTAERVERTLRQKTEAAQRRAEKEAERAQRMAEAVQRRVEHKVHEAHGRRGWAFNFDAARPPMPGRPLGPTRPASPTPPADPVTDEERMVILRMVEQGKITVADAEKLLAALENK